MTDIILKGSHPRTIPAWLGLIWFSGFRGEEAYDLLRTDGRKDDERQLITKAHMALKFGQVS